MTGHRAGQLSRSIHAIRQCYLCWGASADEIGASLPGDELLDVAALTATRAITVRASPAHVWLWLAQVGQGRGGFYSYDWLENLVGCDIHSAEEIVPAWQSIAVGDDVRLHPRTALTVARVDGGRVLVLRGAVPVGAKPAPYDFTWAFVLFDTARDGTRLVVRERYSVERTWARAMVELVELASAVMSRRMLLGIKRRAERVAATGAS